MDLESETVFKNLSSEICFNLNFMKTDCYCQNEYPSKKIEYTDYFKELDSAYIRLYFFTQVYFALWLDCIPDHIPKKSYIDS